jgi:hypothetical protein
MLRHTDVFLNRYFEVKLRIKILHITRLYEKLTLPNPRGSDRGVHDGAYLSKSIEFLDFDKYDRCHHGPRGQATGIRKKVIKSSITDQQ